MQYVRIPKDRVGVLIGPGGKDKERVEKRTGVKLEVQSSDGLVLVDTTGADPILALRIVDYVRAVGRGFAPKRASRLLDEDQYLQVLDIRDHVGKSQRKILQTRGRVIGTEGRTRKVVEDLSGSLVAIQGNTIAVIGDLRGVQAAAEALELLLEGSEHAAVYSFLERTRRRWREEEFLAAAYGIGLPEDKVPPGQAPPPPMDPGEDGGTTRRRGVGWADEEE